MQDDNAYNPQILKSQISMLPPIEQFTLQKLANKRKINFNMMLSLPFLLKDKGLEDRKDTIAIYRKHKFEPLKPQQQKVTLINSGRIHCTEFWSDKYQSTALRDSHIDRNLDKYRQIIRNNIQDYLVKFDMQAKEQLEEAKMYELNIDSRIQQQEVFKKQCSITDEEFTPSNNELNISQCTQDEIINYYRDIKQYDCAKKSSLRNLDRWKCSSVKQSFIERFDKVITTCDQNFIVSNRNSLDSIKTCGYVNIKKRTKHVVGSRTSRTHYN